MKLYEITESIRDLTKLEDNEQVKLALETLQLNFKEKSLNIGKLYRELKSDVQAIEDETKRLSERKQSIQNKMDWFREYLLTNMQLNKIDSIKDSILTIIIRDNPPSCTVPNIENLPKEYVKTIPESYQPDKLLILKHFKETGEIIDGAEIKIEKRVDIK